MKILVYKQTNTFNVWKTYHCYQPDHMKFSLIYRVSIWPTVPSYGTELMIIVIDTAVFVLKIAHLGTLEVTAKILLNRISGKLYLKMQKLLSLFSTVSNVIIIAFQFSAICNEFFSIFVRWYVLWHVLFVSKLIVEIDFKFDTCLSLGE